MRSLALFILITFGILAFYEKVFSFQENKISNKENEINLIEKKLFAFQREYTPLISDSEKLAKEIEGLKISKNKTIWHRYRLEEKLKRSQELSDRIKVLNRNIEEVRNQYKKALKEIIELYNKKIKIAVNDLKKQEIKGEKALRIVKELYDEKSAWQMKIEDEIFNSVIIVEVELNPLDGPDEISEKADILMDIAEDLRKNLTILKKKKDELVEEKEIRAEMGEFVKEIYLFGEKEKGFEGTSLSKQSGESTYDEFYNNLNLNNFSSMWGNRNQNETGRDYLFRLFKEYEIFKDDKFSYKTVDNLVEKYNEIISKLENKAIEIEDKAERYYQIAEDLKKTEYYYK